MFLDIKDFCNAILAGPSPSVSLLTWRQRPALTSLLQRLGPSLRKLSPGIAVTVLDTSECSADSFAKLLVSAMMNRKISTTCLVLYGLEPLVSSAAKILNGFRERLANAKCVIIAIRENRQRDFIIDCPDLMDWIGLQVARAEDLSVPFTASDVRKLLKEFEIRYGKSSEQFLKEMQAEKSGDPIDGWFWRELLHVEEDLEKSHGEK